MMNLNIDDTIYLGQDFTKVMIEHHFVLPNVYDYFIKYEVHV